MFSQNILGNSAFSSTTQKSATNPNKDYEVTSPNEDSTSALAFSPASIPQNYLIAGSWDGQVRCWEVEMSGKTNPKSMQTMGGPILDACWHDDGSKVFVASVDKQVKCWDLASNQTIQVAAHDAPVKTCHWIKASNYTCLMTGSWDKTLKFWDTRTPNPMLTINLPERCYCADVVNDIFMLFNLYVTLKLGIDGETCLLDRFLVTSWQMVKLKRAPCCPYNNTQRVSVPPFTTTSQETNPDYPMAVVSTAGRGITIYMLEGKPQEFRRVDSPLKYQHRVVRIFRDKTTKQPTGFALGSVEGRVAIQYVNTTSPKDNFTFKCHRTNGAQNGYQEIYAVNDIAFHPEHGTLATVGSDGTFSFWDKDSRTKLKPFEPMEQSITKCAINSNGQIFAYAVSYDWSKGHEYNNPAKKNYIFLKPCYEELKPRVSS